MHPPGRVARLLGAEEVVGSVPSHCAHGQPSPGAGHEEGGHRGQVGGGGLGVAGRLQRNEASLATTTTTTTTTTSTTATIPPAAHQNVPVVVTVARHQRRVRQRHETGRLRAAAVDGVPGRHRVAGQSHGGGGGPIVEVVEEHLHVLRGQKVAGTLERQRRPGHRAQGAAGSYRKCMRRRPDAISGSVLVVVKVVVVVVTHAGAESVGENFVGGGDGGEGWRGRGQDLVRQQLTGSGQRQERLSALGVVKVGVVGMVRRVQVRRGRPRVAFFHPRVFGGGVIPLGGRVASLPLHCHARRSCSVLLPPPGQVRGFWTFGGVRGGVVSPSVALVGHGAGRIWRLHFRYLATAVV